MKRYIGMLIMLCVIVFTVSCSRRNLIIDTEEKTDVLSEENNRIPDENISWEKDGKIITEDILIQIQNVVITKELPKTVEKYKINYFDEVCNENGTFDNRYQYVFIDLVIQNRSNVSKELYLNSMLLCHIDEQNSFREPVEEMRYRSGYDFEGISPKDYFLEFLEADETKNVTVGFISEDNFFDIGNSCLKINLSGNVYGYSEIKAIRLVSGE